MEKKDVEPEYELELSTSNLYKGIREPSGFLFRFKYEWVCFPEVIFDYIRVFHHYFIVLVPEYTRAIPEYEWQLIVINMK